MADFLGDPQFPSKAFRTHSRALKISYFQGLYQNYSRLRLTRAEDRPLAIAGLESRLLKAFGTKGGYGIFDDGPDGELFHRSLLWQRGSDVESLKPITFGGSNIKVPTWSWMAYEGGIDYGDPPFGTTDWTASEVQSPWESGHRLRAGSDPENAGLALTATVRDFDVAGRRGDEVRIVYDTKRSFLSAWRYGCVIIARSHDGMENRDKRHYVIVVLSTNVPSAREERSYRRAGVGYMLGKYITLDSPGVVARIH